MTEYTIPQNDRFISYTATAGQTVFPYDFPIFDDDHLEVIQEGTVLTKTTHYTVSGVDVQAGGNVTLVTGATLNDTVVIRGVTPEERTSDFSQAGDFLAATLNRDLDLIVQQTQQLRRDSDKSIKFADDSSTSGIAFPEPSASKFIRYNEDEDGLEAVDISTLGAVAVGTSGDVVGKLNANKTDSGNNTYSGTSTHSDDITLSSVATRTLSILSDGNSRIQLGAVGAGVNDDWLIRKAAASSDLLEMRYDNVLKASLDASTGELKAIGGINPNSSGGSILASFINPTVFAASLTGTANVSAASDTYSQYVRIGNLVIVWGRISVTATTAAGTATTLEMTLPVTSALTDNAQVCGFCWNTNREAINGGVTGNATTDKANFSFSAQSTSARTIVYGFCYPVI